MKLTQLLIDQFERDRRALANLSPTVRKSLENELADMMRRVRSHP